MSERCCKRCSSRELPPPYTAYRCRIFHTLAEADDSCAFYTEAVPFADDEVGDNAELPVEAGA